MKRSMLIAAAVILVGVVALSWQLRSSRDGAGGAGGADRGDKTEWGTAGSRSRPELGRPKTPAEKEALRKQGAERNRLAADLRQGMADKRYGDVVRIAQDLLKLDPASELGHTYWAMAACGLGDRTAAREHYDVLPDSRREFVARRCRLEGLEL